MRGIFLTFKLTTLKTIKEWLSELPEPYKKQALANMCFLEPEVESMIIALGKAFDWSRTIEGFQYWKDFQMDLISKRYSAVPPTNALSAIHAIAFKKSISIEEIESVERWRESADDTHWKYRLMASEEWQIINL